MLLAAGVLPESAVHVVLCGAVPMTLAEFETWHRRWCYTRAGKVLHRVQYGVWDDHDWRFNESQAVCGVRGPFFIPGFMSRMGRQRCERCCTKVGIPFGFGAPFNQSGNEFDPNPEPLTEEQRDA